MQMGQKWDKEYAKAIELDGWGQVEEAREIYDSLAGSMRREMDAVGRDEWTEKQQQAIRNLIICLRLRSEVSHARLLFPSHELRTCRPACNLNGMCGTHAYYDMPRPI